MRRHLRMWQPQRVASAGSTGLNVELILTGGIQLKAISGSKRRWDPVEGYIRIKATVIIVPTLLISQWATEIEAFLVIHCWKNIEGISCTAKSGTAPLWLATSALNPTACLPTSGCT